MAQKIAALFIIAGLFCAAVVTAGAANLGNTVYGFYSETFPGLMYDQPNPGSAAPDGARMLLYGSYVLPISTTAPASGDGIEALRIIDNGSGSQAGAAMEFGNPNAVLTDMSAYIGGTCTFVIRANAEVSITITDNHGYAELFLNANLGMALDNQWHRVTIPLTSAFWGTTKVNGVPTGYLLNFSSVKNMAFATQWLVSGQTGRTFTIDNVLWQKANPTPTVSATLRNYSNNVATTSITWSNVLLGATKWKAADQYLELKLDYFTPGWGIQIYTDNKAPGAAPYRYTGVSTATAAGLVAYSPADPSVSSTTLPMCWRITDVSTTTVNIVRGANPSFPDRLSEATLGSGYPCFLWMMDKATGGFANGLDYITAWDSRGIQHAEATWGAGAFSSNYIYLGADFSAAVTPREYRTRALILELFNE